MIHIINHANMMSQSDRETERTRRHVHDVHSDVHTQIEEEAWVAASGEWVCRPHPRKTLTDTALATSIPLASTHKWENSNTDSDTCHAIL